MENNSHRLESEPQTTHFDRDEATDASRKRKQITLADEQYPTQRHRGDNHIDGPLPQHDSHNENIIHFLSLSQDIYYCIIQFGNLGSTSIVNLMLCNKYLYNAIQKLKSNIYRNESIRSHFSLSKNPKYLASRHFRKIFIMGHKLGFFAFNSRLNLLAYLAVMYPDPRRDFSFKWKLFVTDTFKGELYSEGLYDYISVPRYSGWTFVQPNGTSGQGQNLKGTQQVFEQTFSKWIEDFGFEFHENVEWDNELYLNCSKGQPFPLVQVTSRKFVINQKAHIPTDDTWKCHPFFKSITE